VRRSILDENGRVSVGTLLLGLFLFAAIGGGFYVVWVGLFGVAEPTNVNTTGIDVSRVQEQQVSDFTPSQPVASPMPVAGRGLTPPPQQAPAPAPGPSTSHASASPTAGQPGVSTSELKQEQEFLARHRPEILAEHRKLDQITGRYYRQYKAVRDVDAAFGRMPRYMQVKKAYETNLNPYAFARDALALPEVRQEIARRMADPECWKAALGMITETIKTAPPTPAVYDEAKRFMRSEGTMTNYMAEEFVPNVQKNANAAKPALQNADPAVLMKLQQDLSPAGMGLPAMPAMPTTSKR
jgi:hypothetical protein